MLIIILVLLLLSLLLFYYTNCPNKKILKEGFPIEVSGAVTVPEATVMIPEANATVEGEITIPEANVTSTDTIVKWPNTVVQNAPENDGPPFKTTNVITDWPPIYVEQIRPIGYQIPINPKVLATQNAANIASLSSELNNLIDVRKWTQRTHADVKMLNSKFSKLASMKQNTLQNAADIKALEERVNPLLALRQQVSSLAVETKNNSTTILDLGKSIQKAASLASNVSSAKDLNKTLHK